LILRLSAASFLFLILAVHAEAASVRLAWDPSPGSEVMGYKVHYGTEPGKYTQTIRVEGRLAVKAVIDNLEEGKTYFFAVSSYDVKGRESPYSSEITNDRRKNRALGRAGKARERTRPQKTANLQGTRKQGNGPAEAQAQEPKKISRSRKVPQTSEGKILHSR
jgi:hypothetical protein